MKKILCGNELDKMPGWSFRIMAFMFRVADVFNPKSGRLAPFCLQQGQTVVDYGSGTGRFIPEASRRVGDNGIVYAVDIHELAVEAAHGIIRKHNLNNVKPLLTDGKTVDIPAGSVDIIYALDMFHMVKKPPEFLAELARILKPDGILYLEDGHQSRTSTREKVMNSGEWKIADEAKAFVKLVKS
jgi:ubiquinone/menaquinone biosynthesis C-methylase UbiE